MGNMHRLWLTRLCQHVKEHKEVYLRALDHDSLSHQELPRQGHGVDNVFLQIIFIDCFASKQDIAGAHSIAQTAQAV